MSNLRRTLVALTVAMALTALTAPSALALFTTSGKLPVTSGKGSTGDMTLTDEGDTWSCKAAPLTWAIKSAGGVATKSGPNLNLTIAEKPNGWNCNGLEVGECKFNLNQNEESSVELFSVLKSCTATFPGCRIIIPATKGNEALKELRLENSGTNNARAKLALTGIVSEAENLGLGCSGISHLKNSAVELKGEAEFEEVRETGGGPTVAVNNSKIQTTGLAEWAEKLVYKVTEGVWTPGSPVDNVTTGKASWLTVTNLCSKASKYKTGESCEVELKFSEPAFGKFRSTLEFKPAPNVKIESN